MSAVFAFMDQIRQFLLSATLFSLAVVSRALRITYFLFAWYFLSLFMWLMALPVVIQQVFVGLKQSQTQKDQEDANGTEEIDDLKDYVVENDYLVPDTSGDRLWRTPSPVGSTDWRNYQ